MAPISLRQHYMSSKELTLTARRAREAVRALNAIAAASSGVTGINCGGESRRRRASSLDNETQHFFLGRMWDISKGEQTNSEIFGD
jgi:hypothetical protein